MPSASARPNWSVDPPGVYGTISLMGRSGYAAPAAVTAPNITANVSVDHSANLANFGANLAPTAAMPRRTCPAVFEPCMVSPPLCPAS
ncbi:hypothetical protein GCM10009078_46140 [Cupriavidus gilardii]